MVKPFQFARLPLIYFGKGTIAELPQITGRYGSSALLVTGERSFMGSAAADQLIRQFIDRNMSYHHVRVCSEPSPGLVDETVRSFSDINIDAVVSIGGGSAIDAGKAISAMLYKNGSVRDYLEVVGGKDHPGTKVPFIAVPTTSGTGSEATKNAVISEPGRDGFKRSLRHDNLVPDVALADPELTLTCPSGITAAAGLDCFTQLAEAYLSDRSNEFTDAIALEGLKAVRRSLLRCFTHGDDIEARSDMSFAALSSGICLTNAGLGAVHGIAGAIGGIYEIPHGVICGTLMGIANEINVRELRKSGHGHHALRKYAFMGRIFSDREGASDDYYIDNLVDEMHLLTEQLDLPGLGSYGLVAADIPAVADLTQQKNNPVRLTADQIAEIIERRV